MLTSRHTVGQVEEIPGAIDLWGRRPGDGVRVIFECKTIDSNELSQCRGALAQLLEYRYEYGDESDDLCIVADQPVSTTRLEFLESIGVGVVIGTVGMQLQGTLSGLLLENIEQPSSSGASLTP